MAAFQREICGFGAVLIGVARSKTGIGRQAAAYGRIGVRAAFEATGFVGARDSARAGLVLFDGFDKTQRLLFGLPGFTQGGDAFRALRP